MPGKKWALLVGIDEYLEGNTSRLDTKHRPIAYEPLRGCVSDVLLVQRHLVDHMGVSESHIKKLVTRAWNDETPAGSPEPADEIPTYFNITAAINWILEATEAGDLVYIHYSGHGAQATTVFPTLKGDAGLDEALVPTDINTETGKYVRDIELSLYLKKMVDKGLIVTVVLDCCHSASATRGAGRVGLRGIPQTYKSSTEDFPTRAYMEEVHAHGIGTAEIFKESRVKDTWLLQPQGYTLLAACRPREQAREYELCGVYQGALTYWLLDTLRMTPQAAASTKTLYRRVFNRVQSLFSDQTPVIGGTTDRAFFGTDVLPAVHTITVRRAGLDGGPPLRENDELELAAGALHSVRKGSRYAIFSSVTDTESRGEEIGSQIAIVTVTEVAAVTSKARLAEVNDAEKIKPDCRAVLLCVPTHDQILVAVSSTYHTRMLENMTASRAVDMPWVRLVSDEDPRLPTLRVDINSSSCFEIQEGDGAVWPNIVPPLPPLSVEANGSVDKLIYRLKHLALFNMFKKLENLDGTSAMRGSLLFEVLGKSKDGSLNSSQTNLAPLEDCGGTLVARHNDTLFLRFKNISKKEMTINFAVFNLQPLFGIEQIYPVGGEFETLDRDEERVIPLIMTYPSAELDCMSVMDTFKVLVSPQPITVSELHLPDLDKAEANRRRGSQQEIHQLHSLLQKFTSPHRNGRVPSPVHSEWGTEEISIRTMR
ncbi:hypothetical protein VSDG_08455 [Cytospora chrysosperma]|uniref:Peptidase C14 caspase domain-containing protein n=1 Tax=Cytospora chrysosperma TaxID=252740 RepID=A0A423VHS4_CYTCH|nr:hypothetical protein VSDG_08455 [Valsa sordida]